MCGFYSRDEITKEDFRKIYGVADPDPQLLKGHFGIRPKSVNVVVTKNSPNRAEPMLWWFHPGWPQLPLKRGVINVRVESLKEGKPYFKKAFKSQRCLIPASAWVEWKEMEGVKVPHAFKLKTRHHFAFAGLWNEYPDSEGKLIKGYAIITGLPNRLARAIHDRQPRVLREKDIDTWLDPSQTDEQKLLACLATYGDDDMEVHPVSLDLKDDNEDLLRPISATKLKAQIANRRIVKNNKK